MPNGPHRLKIGLKPLSLGDWIEDQPDFGSQLEVRREVLDRHPDVIVRAPESSCAEHELLAMLTELLPASLPQHYTRVANGLRVEPTGEVWPIEVAEKDPLGTIARWVPDDFCFMHADAQGTYRLRSAVVCFPTRWQLHAKLGRGLTPIHAPVPGYEDELGKGVEQVFERLTVERPLWRINWSIVDAPDLYQPIRPLPEDTRLGGERVVRSLGERLWLRTERQSIVRLPVSGAVIFGIRIRQVRLDQACAADPGIAERVVAHIDSMPEPLKRYKGLVGIEERLRAYLGEITG